MNAIESDRVSRSGDSRPGSVVAIAPRPELFGWGVGDSVQFTINVSQKMIELYANLSGDHNPVHNDSEYAEETRFGGKIAHGMLTASFISAALAQMTRPGYTVIYLRQELVFLNPAMDGDVLTTKVMVEELILEKKRMKLNTACTNQDDIHIIRGNALVLLDPHPFR